MTRATISSFIRWANQVSYRRGLLCHLYISSSTKQYFDKTDYALFNLIADSRGWIVKGTADHGIRSKRGKVSPVPCLNCFEINEMFFEALKKLKDGHKFEFGIVLNKRRLANNFKVINVEARLPKPLPPPKECHHYDSPRNRPGALSPFHYCDVVRVEIPQGKLWGAPITVLPRKTLLGYLVKKRDHEAFQELFEQKPSKRARIFPVL